MSENELLERELELLGERVSPRPAFVADVMARVGQVAAASPRPGAFVRRPGRRVLRVVTVAAACLISAILFVALPFGSDKDRAAGGWWLGPASAYAQELVTVLDRARPGGVVAREQTTFVMSDGARHLSSTVSTLFMVQDRYRRDIFDGNRIRESQWYVPGAEGVTQTSVRFEDKTFVVDRHRDASAAGGLVTHMRRLAGAVARADRRLEPEEIDGRECIGFEISGGKLEGAESKGNYRIWFDVETRLPARIEYELKEVNDSIPEQGIRGLAFTLDRLEWNPRLPGNTFDPDVPEGFHQAGE